MKKILLFIMAFATMTTIYSCQSGNDGKCHIEGTVNGEQFEGKRIFLVPLTGPATAETVDSMEITDGKFHFTTADMKMYKILLDIHYRVGIQQLIIVGEPGTVHVSLDTVSHATGTPQNDSLDQWKVRTEMHNLQLNKMRQHVTHLRNSGDTLQAQYIKQRADSFHIVYKNYTRQMAKNMDGTVLGNFLKELFPLTYQQKLPDGRVVTKDADTHEEISE